MGFVVLIAFLLMVLGWYMLGPVIVAVIAFFILLGCFFAGALGVIIVAIIFMIFLL